MQILIPIQKREIAPTQPVDTINARDLWEFLDSKQEFTAWLFARLDKYKLLADEDYLIDKVIKQVPHQGGTRNSVCVEYHLTVERAKELAMLENNDRGREVRKYFIECERLAKEAAEAVRAKAAETEQPPPLDPMQVLNDPAVMRGLLLNYTEKVLTLQATVDEQAPKVEALNRLAVITQGSLCITDAAKSLQVRPGVLFKWLEANDWIYRRSGSPYIAYQPRIKQGFLEHKLFTAESRNGEDKIVQQIRVTPKGLTYLAETLSKPIRS